MSLVSEQVERWIVRRLDGELSAEDSVELDRELLRNPAAREMLASYAALDELAAEVLKDCAERRQPRLVVPAGERVATGRASGGRRGAWMVAGSLLAACLAMVVFLKTPDPRPMSTPIAKQSENGVTVEPARTTAVRHGGGVPWIGQPIDGGVWRVSDRPAPVIDRTTDNNVLMLSDEKGNVYFLNFPRTREIEHGARPNGKRLTGNPI